MRRSDYSKRYCRARGVMIPVAEIGRSLAKRGPKGDMTDEHRTAWALGFAESRAVRVYLGALRAHFSGRRRTLESIELRLTAIESEIDTLDPIKGLRLIRERRDLLFELEVLTMRSDPSVAEQDFVEVAASYGRRNGISYASWREIGVAANVLSRAGVSRS